MVPPRIFDVWYEMRSISSRDIKNSATAVRMKLW
jgi:hypothetical protein